MISKAFRLYDVAAEALAAGDVKHADILRAFERLEGRFNTMTSWSASCFCMGE